ncbi:MAG: LysR family glycine cleavage system transcriptional activator [Glaciecola sp.]
MRVSAINSFTSIWILPKLSSFQALHPDIMLQIAPSNELIDFEIGEIDIAIRMGRGNYKDLQSKLLFKDEMILVSSPSLLKQEPALDAESIFTLPWIEDTSADVDQIFKLLCEQNKIIPSSIVPVIRSDNSLTIIESVLQSRGIALVNRCLVQEEVNTGKLLPLLDFSHPSPYSLYLVAPETNFKWEKIRQFENWFIPLINEYFGQRDN